MSENEETSSEEEDGQAWLASGFEQDEQETEETLRAALRQRERIEARHWSLNAMQSAKAVVQVKVAAAGNGQGANVRIQQVIGQQQMMVWDCSLVLSRFLETNPQLVVGKRVVELGCGVGLPGMFGKALGASFVLLTERPSAISFIQKQIDNNQHLWQDGKISAKALEWTSNSDSEQYKDDIFQKPFDLVLCSDLIYAGDSETTTDLVHTIRKLTAANPEATVISSYEVRHVGMTHSSTSSSSDQQTLFSALMRTIAGFDIVSPVAFQDLPPECRDESIVVHLYSRGDASYTS